MKGRFLRYFAPLLAAALGAVALAPCALAQPASEAAAPLEPKIMALKFHADWCGYCKAMGSVYEEMQAKYDREPVLWITLDQTRENDRRQSEYLARALGLDEIWKENGGKTGFILLVEPGTERIVERLTHEQSLKEMGAKLLAALGEPSS